jgi:hypothetical protein
MIPTEEKESTGIYKLSKDEIGMINNRLLLLKGKIEGMLTHTHINILGDPKVHVDILTNGVDRLVLLIIADTLPMSSIVGHLSKLEEYFTLISKP